MFSFLSSLLSIRRRLRSLPIHGGTLAGLGVIFFLSGCASLPPPTPREFRAAWVATVSNIDWPSRPGLSVAEQQAEILAILNRAQGLHLNAIILQVRPAADALYHSPLEPWSEYLTGVQGKAPDPFYDPLEFWIKEAHRRGLELHAWLNPYRARQAGAKSPLAKNHISRTHPAVVKSYGDLLWMDPGEPLAVERTLAVVRDITQRYDVDAIHVDDYFYPYPIPVPGAPRPPDLLQPGSPPPPVPEVDFPDDPSWKRYRSTGGTLSRPDWRRQQVDALVLEMGKTVKQIKPWVRFGVSPFGIGRPDLRPAGIEGFSQYDKLYADVERWWKEGWVDYLAPQLYWPIEQKPQAFGVLLNYWAEHNRAKRHLWPGLYTSRINATDKSWSPTEIEQQIALIRSNPGGSGHIHFSMVALTQNRRGVSEQLAQSTYSSPALIPATPWLERNHPLAPRIDVASRFSPPGVAPELEVKFLETPGKKPALYSVWFRRGKTWHFSVVPASEPSFTLSAPLLSPSETVNRIVVTAIDRVGNESPRTNLSLPSK